MCAHVSICIAVGLAAAVVAVAGVAAAFDPTAPVHAVAGPR
jgi:hypothetical protein